MKVGKKKINKVHIDHNMIIGTQTLCAAANLVSTNLKGGTDFSIAAIMARGGSCQEPSGQCLSEYQCIQMQKCVFFSFV